MGRIQRQFVILLTTATIIMGISTVAMLIPQAAYATEDEEDRFSSSSDDDENDGDCASDEQPASIDGKISCMGPGECYSEQFEFAGKKVKHCNSLMTAE
ncbi:MAG TPA: hypothetical protein VE445_00670 [Nitrososphaeraceae archaeon]|jgi:hypothetical protein|nr:hypothetical protein [Nitrososphaeraceae archaeon]